VEPVTSVAVTPGSNVIKIALVEVTGADYANGQVVAVGLDLTVDTYEVTLSLVATDQYDDSWNYGNFSIKDSGGQIVYSSDGPDYSQAVLEDTFQLPAGDYEYTLAGGNYPSEIQMQLTRTDPGYDEHIVTVPMGTLTNGADTASGTFSLYSGNIPPALIYGSVHTSGFTGYISNVYVNSEAFTQGAVSWDASLSPFGEVGTVADRVEWTTPATLVLDGSPNQIAYVTNSYGSYFVYLIAKDASGVILAKKTLVFNIEAPSVFINSGSEWVGTHLGFDYDPKGHSDVPVSYSWQRYVGPYTHSWASILDYSYGAGMWVDITGGSYQYDPTMPDDNRWAMGYRLRSVDDDRFVRVKSTLDTGMVIYSNAAFVHGTHNGKVAEYTLSSGLLDSLGNHNGLNLEGSGFVHEAGENRGVLDVTNGSFEIPSEVLSGVNTAYSISMNIKPTSFDSDYNMIMSNHDSSMGLDASFLMWADEFGQLHVAHLSDNALDGYVDGYVDGYGGGLENLENVVTDPGCTLTPGVWNQVTLSWVASDDPGPSRWYVYSQDQTGPGILKIYIDEVVRAEGEMDVRPWPSPANLKVGGEANLLGEQADGIKGYVAEIKIWQDIGLHSWDVQNLSPPGSFKLYPATPLPSRIYTAPALFLGDGHMVFIEGELITSDQYTLSEATDEDGRIIGSLITFNQELVDNGVLKDSYQVSCAKVT
jgi:hypothetical protein